MSDGYTACACRDCFEIAIGKQGKALCNECEEAGCAVGNGECCVEQDWSVAQWVKDGACSTI